MLLTDPWLQFVFWLVVWQFVKGGVAVCVVAAFFVLDGSRGVGLSRVILRLAVGVVGFVGDIVDARSVCLRNIYLVFSSSV